MVPRAVLMKSGLVSLNTVRQVNTAHLKIRMNSARPMANLSKSAHSTVKWPIHNNTTFKNSNFNQRVNTIKDKKFNTVRPKAVVNAARPNAVVNVVNGNNVNVVKASTCWVWKPKSIVLDHGNPQMDLQDKGVIDSGCSRHVTGNMSYLTDYEEIHGGYVAFGGNPKRRKITRKCTIKTADSKLPTTFWVEAVNTAYYVQNKVLITKPHNKTPYELFLGRKPALGFIRSFGCLVTILNTIDHLGKFDGKADEGFFFGYSINSLAFRVFNRRTRMVEENLHVQFSENTPNIAGSGPNWLFDIDALTKSMNYKQVVAGNQSNGNAGTKACDDAGKASMETVPEKDYILLPLWTADPPFSQSLKSSPNDGSKPSTDDGKKVDENPRKESEFDDGKKVDENLRKESEFNDQKKVDENPRKESEFNDQKKVDENPRKESEFNDQKKEDDVNSTNNVNAASTNEVNAVGAKISIEPPDDPNMPALEDIVYSDDDDEDVGAEVDMNNLDAFMPVSPIPTTRMHKDHPVKQIIEDLNSAPQTRRMSKNLEEHGFVIHALKDPSWIEAMLEELLHFKLQEVWTLVDLPNGKRAIGTKWVFRNKKNERGLVIKNKARLVAQGYTQEEGIDYEEVFSPVARIEEIWLFLAYALFKDFVVYQIDVKSAFLYSKIEEEVYVCQPPGFEDPDFPDRVYKVEKTLYGLHQAPRAWYETLSTYLLDNGFQRGKIDKNLFIRRDKGDILLVQVYVDDIIFSSTKKSLCIEFEKMMHKKFQMSSMGELTFFLGLQVKQKEDVIFIIQDKYVTEILKKFGFTDVKTASTPMKTQKPLLKDEDGEEVDVHLYRSMIGSLMYLTSSRPDIMFAVCACARYQVNPKVSHLYIVKRIFRYLKGQPKLGLLYPKDSPFDLVAYTDSDYVGASLDRKSTIGGCQFLGSRLISWQCKKQTVVANFTTKAEYVAASSCCGQVLWIQNQLLNYGYREYDLSPLKLVFEFSIYNVWKSVQYGVSNGLDTVYWGFLGVGTTFDIFQNIILIPYLEYDVDDSLERAATTATGLEAEQDSGSGPRRQETMGDTIAQTRFKNVSKLSNDPLLARGNTLQSGKDRLKLKKLIALCTTLQSRVLALETTKTTQATKIASLKKRVKQLERRNKSRTHGLKRLYRVGSSRRVESSEDEDMFGVNDLDGDEVIVESVDLVNTAEETRSVVEEVTAVTIHTSC
ncbi:putative ribonuclease H-like domain-containing protein [Tanacetum coccineum]